MKFKTTLLIISSLILASCSVDNEPINDEITANLFTAVQGDPGTTTSNTTIHTTDLFAGQTIDVGTVTVEVSPDDDVIVTYETDGDWQIDETHLYIGPLGDLPTNGGGNPKIGQFPLSNTHTSGTNNFVYISTTLAAGECAYIAAHAVVTNTTTGQNETAWGDGDPIGGNSWAMMFEVCN
ncbi:MAG: hypothetical protein KJO23_01075 [Bacteroidia bacterium]|nr:hypothetical protein [Bacteroidia bacterium]